MTPLTAREIVQLVDWGQGKHTLDRGLGLLALAAPDHPPDQLADVTLGTRDDAIIGLRAATFGVDFEMHVSCPACQEQMEFTLTADALRLPAPASEILTVSLGGADTRFRLPTSRDLAAIPADHDGGAVRRRLVQILQVDGPEITVDDGVAETVTRAIEDWDPRAVILARLACVECSTETLSVFEPVPYFWAELELYAERIQDEVHAIAREYGWSEAAILDMAPSRRHRYLELIDGG